jgi:MFS transporter, PAT family, beta-lactamase induction signal transducer AmpG
MATATSAGSGGGMILTRSKPLRLLTPFLFYFTQGFPVGLFSYAVPSWMAANGVSTAAVASVVAMASLPWSLKLVNGFIIDRYTFLAMGRRRSWIIGAQAVIVLALLAGAALSPGPRDVFLLAAFAFAANMAVTFQDVGIDSLAVDIMAEDERAKASGIMFGAQTLGIAAATGLGGALLEAYGFAICMIASALIPAGVMIYGSVIREREGEKRLPWSKGESHPHNRAIQVAAWLPLLKNALRAITAPLSLALLPVLLANSLPAGAHEAFHPGLATGLAGWSLSDYTNVIATSQLIVGLLGLVVGGWAVDAIGAQRSTIIVLLIQIVMAVAMIAAQPYWTNDTVLTGYFFGGEFISTFASITLIPIAMRLCSPAVAATQFTIYMAVANFGRPLGASLAAATAGAGSPLLMYGLIVAIYAAAAVWLLIIRFPGEDRAFHDGTQAVPAGEGIAPVRD